MGHVTPLSFVPHQNLPYTEDMTFFQRVYNIFLTTYDLFLRRFNYIPAQNKLVKKYFRDGIQGEIPNVIELEKEIALTLVNSHQSFDTPRPRMPGQINVGAAHINQAYVMPNDLRVSFSEDLTLIYYTLYDLSFHRNFLTVLSMVSYISHLERT